MIGTRARLKLNWLDLARAGGLVVIVAAISTGLISPAFADTPTLHVVAWGETLYSIARAYDLAPQVLASANGIGVNQWVYAGERLTIPSSATAVNPAVSATTPSGYYTVRAGDTLFSIATRFGATLNAIAAANDLPANGVLYVGWTLKIPGASANQSPTASSNLSTMTYIVQPGEYLARIALRYNTTVQVIAQANDLPNNWIVYAGQRLVIPNAQTQAPAPIPVAAPSDARAANVPVYQQKQTLTCEEAAAAMATRGAISEAQLVAVLPRSDNPFAGIRGRTNSPNFGGLSDYGIYAQGLQKGLSALGVKSAILYGQSFDDFKNSIVAQLRAGHAIVWWHTWQDTYQTPVWIRTTDGASVKLTPYEHAGTLVAANDRGVTYNDPYDATVRFVSWDNFRRVSAYFDNMALVIVS